MFMFSVTFKDFAIPHVNATSLEQLHYAIRQDAGCAGQFRSEELAAFDPLLLVTSFAQVCPRLHCRQVAHQLHPQHASPYPHRPPLGLLAVL